MTRRHTVLFALVALAATACAACVAWPPELAATHPVSAAAPIDALQVVNIRY